MADIVLLGTVLNTFFQARKLEQFDETEIIPRDQNLSLEVSVHCVHVVCVRVLLPDAVDLISKDPGECVPVYAGDLFSVSHLFPSY